VVVLKAGAIIRTGDTPDILADTDFLSSAGL